jgi:hypothetical protein
VKKPADLRKHLQETVPSLGKNPDKLHVFVEKGSVATKAGASSSFEYRYKLYLVITDFAEPVDALVVPLLAWIETKQPNLILDTDKRDKAINLEAELIDHEKADVAITLELSERVLVTKTEDGWSCEHIGEPALPDLTGPTVWGSFVGGELLAGVDVDAP